MATKKTLTKEISFHHREDAEWLTKEICNRYRKQATQLINNDGNNVGAIQCIGNKCE